MPDPESLKIKQARVQILANLNILCPTPAMLRTLYRSLIYVNPSYDQNLFEKDIWYLHEKRYISYVDDALGGARTFFDKVVTLTSHGKEIAERTAADPALEI